MFAAAFVVMCRQHELGVSVRYARHGETLSAGDRSFRLAVTRSSGASVRPVFKIGIELLCAVIVRFRFVQYYATLIRQWID